MRKLDTSLDCDGFVREYPTLAVLVHVFKVLAWVTLLSGGWLALVLFDSAAPAREGQGFDLARHGLAVVCVFSTVISFVTLLAISQVIRLLLDAAHDWSVTALATRRSFEES